MFSWFLFLWLLTNILDCIGYVADLVLSYPFNVPVRTEARVRRIEPSLVPLLNATVYQAFANSISVHSECLNIENIFKMKEMYQGLNKKIKNCHT